jgi:SAM-dependent methyltransferase
VGDAAGFILAEPLTVSAMLSDRDRQKLDDGDDSRFYDSPRFVTHADDGFLDRLTDLYADLSEPGDRVFDAMGSWVSFLPDYEYDRVVGHGLNEAELAANDRLDEYFVQNFNREQELPLATGEFDVLCCALSVQYLQYPAAVFAEFGRVLAPDGTAVVSFTNRMFPTKAVLAWRERSMDDRAALVEGYFEAGGFAETTRVVDQPETDPFYAVIGTTPE